MVQIRNSVLGFLLGVLPAFTVLASGALAQGGGAGGDRPQTIAPSCPSGFVFSGGRCVRGSAPAPSSSTSWALVIPKALGVKSALEMDGAAICLVTGSQAETAVNGYFQRNNMQFAPVPTNSISEATTTFQAGRCDAFVVGSGQAHSILGSLSPAGANMVLPELISCANCGPATTVPTPTAAPAPVSEAQLAFEIQRELKRIGCLPGAVDGIWGRGSRAALLKFSRRSGILVDSEPAPATLAALRLKGRGFCPRAQATPKRVTPRKKATSSQARCVQKCTSVFRRCKHEVVKECEGCDPSDWKHCTAKLDSCKGTCAFQSGKCHTFPNGETVCP